MAYIRKNVNLFLLLLLVAIVGAVAGLSTYYQMTYKNLSVNYENKINEISGLVTDLQVHREKLSEKEQALQAEQQREQELTGHYGEIKNEKEQLAGDLQKKGQELDDTVGKLQAKTAEANKATYDLSLAQQQIEQLNGQVRKFQSEAATYRSSWQACQDQINSQPAAS
ncbi:MAG: hypothetical protein Q7R76_03180 [Candidatus Woesearchaeota archaeon]|nr:hypothetical protein [Candidatus Woesearchaeota archaeon]